jgi:hypothetical protein
MSSSCHNNNPKNGNSNADSNSASISIDLSMSDLKQTAPKPILQSNTTAAEATLTPDNTHANLNSTPESSTSQNIDSIPISKTIITITHPTLEKVNPTVISTLDTSTLGTTTNSYESSEKVDAKDENSSDSNSKKLHKVQFHGWVDVGFSHSTKDYDRSPLIPEYFLFNISSLFPSHIFSLLSALHLYFYAFLMN